YGRGGGVVGRGRAVGAGPLGVPVGVAVGDVVAVGVGVGVRVAVAVGVGVITPVAVGVAVGVCVAGAGAGGVITAVDGGGAGGGETAGVRAVGDQQLARAEGRDAAVVAAPAGARRAEVGPTVRHRVVAQERISRHERRG